MISVNYRMSDKERLRAYILDGMMETFFKSGESYMYEGKSGMEQTGEHYYTLYHEDEGFMLVSFNSDDAMMVSDTFNNYHRYLEFAVPYLSYQTNFRVNRLVNNMAVKEFASDIHFNGFKCELLLPVGVIVPGSAFKLISKDYMKERELLICGFKPLGQAFYIASL